MPAVKVNMTKDICYCAIVVGIIAAWVTAIIIYFGR